jgi:hypothetical protein
MGNRMRQREIAKQEIRELNMEIYMNHILKINGYNDFVSGWDCRDMSVWTVRGNELPYEIASKCIECLEWDNKYLNNIAKKINTINLANLR